MLDVAEEHVQARDEQRQPGDEHRRRATASGIAVHTVERASGTKTSDSTMRIAIITAYVTACVATIENATSWRGNRTFLISSALSTIDRDADCSETEKKIQQASPASR